MTLIEDGIKGGLKKYSTIALMLIGAVQVAWSTSPELQAIMGPEGLSTVTTILAILGFIGRFIKQVQPILEE